MEKLLQLYVWSKKSYVVLHIDDMHTFDKTVLNESYCSTIAASRVSLNTIVS